MRYGQHINHLLRRIDTVQTARNPPSFTWCPAFYPVLLGKDLQMSLNTLISPLKNWSEGGQTAFSCQDCSMRHCAWCLLPSEAPGKDRQRCCSLWGEIKAQELINVCKVARCVPAEGERRAWIFSTLPPSFFRAEIPINAHDARFGLAFFTTVQPSLRTLTNSQILL